MFSCEKTKDHYHISGINIRVGSVSTGPNEQCITIGNKTDSLYADMFAVQIEFKREYYASDSSESSGIMYSPVGWGGCIETIETLAVSSKSIDIKEKLVGNTTITGVGKEHLSSFHCQEQYDCDCRNALSIPTLDSLVSAFNSHQKTKSRIFISEKYDDTPFVFFIQKKELATLEGQQIKIYLKMSDGTIIQGVSNKIRL